MKSHFQSHTTQCKVAKVRNTQAVCLALCEITRLPRQYYNFFHLRVVIINIIIIEKCLKLGGRARSQQLINNGLFFSMELQQTLGVNTTATSSRIRLLHVVVVVYSNLKIFHSEALHSISDHKQSEVTIQQILTVTILCYTIYTTKYIMNEYSSRSTGNKVGRLKLWRIVHTMS